MRFLDSASRIRVLSFSKLAINKKNDNDITIFWHDVIVIFWRSFISLVKFSYCSKFYVNIMTGFKNISIFFYKELTRNLEIRNTPVWVFPNIWRLGKVTVTKFGMNVFNKTLMNVAKLQFCSFYRFLVIKVKPRGWGGGKITASNQIRVKIQKNILNILLWL